MENLACCSILFRTYLLCFLLFKYATLSNIWHASNNNETISSVYLFDITAFDRIKTFYFIFLKNIYVINFLFLKCTEPYFINFF